MVYVAGFIGLIFGFAAGQAVLFFMLRGVSKEDLLNDPYLKWKYGMINWFIAGLGVYMAVRIYEQVSAI